MAKKANYEDFRALIDEKADSVVIKAQLAHKASNGDVEQIKQLVERVQFEL